MAAGNESKATFTIALEDDASDAADGIAGALRSLKREIDSDTKAVSEMQRALRNLKGATTPNTAEMDKLSKAISLKKDKIASAQTKWIELGGTYKKTGAGLKTLKQQMQEMAAGANVGGINLGKLFAGLKAGPLGAIAVVVALALAVRKLVGALRDAVVATARYAIESGNARRAERLRLEGVTRLRTVYSIGFGLARDKAVDLQHSIDRVTSSTAISRDKAVDLTTQIQRLGLRGNNAAEALKGLAIVSATQSEEQVSRWLHWYQILGLGGGAVDGLTRRIQRDLGGIAADQLLDLDVQAQHLKQNMDLLFADVDITPFLRVRRWFVDAIGDTTVWGKTLKRVLGGSMQPLIDATVVALTALKRLWQGGVIGALLIEKAWLKVRGLFLRTFGKPVFDDLSSNLDAFVYAGIGAVFLLAIPLGIVAAFLGVIALGLYAIYYGVRETAKAFKEVGGWISSFFTETDWSGIGTGIGNGIADGIMAAGQAVFDAVGWVARKAQQVFRTALQIQSPSKVFSDLGKQLSLGLALGVTTAAPNVDKSIAGLIGQIPTTPGGAAPTATGRAPGGVVNNIRVETIEVYTDEKTLTSAGGMAALTASLKREMEKALLDLAISMGAAAQSGG